MVRDHAPRFGSPYRSGLVQSPLAAVVVGGCAAAGADPSTRLCLWVGAPGTIGISVLMQLTALATVVYFLRRNPATGTRAAVVVGVANCVLLAIALYVGVGSMGLITAASPAVNAVLVGIVPLTLLIGLGTALWMRGARPATYARIGEGQGTDVPADAAMSPAGVV